MTRPWRIAGDGVRVLVRVTPKSAREGVAGLAETAQGAALAVRVHAAPEGGEANRAVERLLAAWVGVSKGCVAVTAGGKSRIKTVAIAGDPAGLAARIGVLAAKLH